MKNKPIFLRRAICLLLLSFLFCTLLPGVFASATEATAPPAFASNEELEALVQQFKDDFGNIDLGVALRFTETGEELYYNADAWYYTASLYKLPMLMQIARLQEAGEGERFENMYEDFERARHDILAYSSNYFALGLSQFFTEHQLSDGAMELSGQELDELEIRHLYSGKYSPRFYLGILQELYENEEHYPRIVEYM